jgi:hypothetical protein
VLVEVVQMRHHVGGLASYGANRVAVVAVVEENGVVLVQSGQLLGCACACAVIVYTLANSEVLVLAAGDGAERDCCND